MLAETYVFGKQLHGFLSCGPLTVPTTVSEHWAQLSSLDMLSSITRFYTGTRQEVNNLTSTTVRFLKRKLALLHMCYAQ